MFTKPSRLREGDRVAIISPSWGGPNQFPHIYEEGLRILREFGLEVIEFPTARMDENALFHNPKLRADDINVAFADKKIKAIFCSIGGDDSIRILPYLSKEIISKNPKILIGYSDNTTILIFCNMLGMVTFHGPTVMSGFAQMKSFTEEYKKSLSGMLFSNANSYAYESHGAYCEGYPDWSQIENVGKTNKFKQDDGMEVLQGKGSVQGKLLGGCIEVIDFMKGTSYYPETAFFKDKLFFLETSEDKPSIESIRKILRNYGVQGVFSEINGLLFGRLRDYSDAEKREFYSMVLGVLNEEFNNYELPIIANMDFGHTDPQIVLPLGVTAKIDLTSKTLVLVENWLVDN